MFFVSGLICWSLGHYYGSKASNERLIPIIEAYRVELNKMREKLKHDDCDCFDEEPLNY